MNWKKWGLLGATVSAAAAFLLRRRLIAHWLDLPPPRYRIAVRRNLRVFAEDGVALATDHYAPRQADADFPTILIRTPYGKGLAPRFHARRFAERGYHVLVQDVRGRFGSGGKFEPFTHEAADGAATVAWLQQQPWFNGVLGTWGQSYLAYTQWALAMAAPQSFTTLFPSLPSARGPFSGQLDEAQLLELPLRWMLVLDALRTMPGGQGAFAPWIAAWRLTPRGQERALDAAFAHLPFAECDEMIIGEQIPYFRQLMNNEVSERQRQADYQGRLGQISQPVLLLGGWYDFMLVDMLQAYEELVAAGRTPFLTIGPWHHVHPEISRVTLRDGLAWFDAQLKGDSGRLRRKPVAVYVMGAGEWRQYDQWPPPSQPASLFLQPGGRLDEKLPDEEAGADSYLYDPMEPTPAVGGALFFSGAGRRDNRALEARSDVLTYTTAALDKEVEVIGPVKVKLYLSSSRPYTDFFARLCDGHPDGRSLNLCDGIIRLYPGKAPVDDEEVMVVEIDLLATAHRFGKGHAIRLQVSSGAHPRFAPNPGRRGPVRSPSDMLSARQTIHWGKRYPSALILPLV